MYTKVHNPGVCSVGLRAAALSLAAVCESPWLEPTALVEVILCCCMQVSVNQYELAFWRGVAWRGAARGETATSPAQQRPGSRLLRKCGVGRGRTG